MPIHDTGLTHSVFSMAPPIDVVIASLVISIVLKKRRRKPSIWCKQWLLQRQKHTHINLLKELTDYTTDYRNYLRMDEDTYERLLVMVGPLIEKKDTIMRKSITPHERLAATLRFLATGRSFEDLKFTTCISPQALGRIIPETCQAIYQCLVEEYMKVGKITIFYWVFCLKIYPFFSFDVNLFYNNVQFHYLTSSDVIIN